MAAAFMSVMVAMAARGPDTSQLNFSPLSTISPASPVLLLARLTSPKFLAWLFPAWAAQSSSDLAVPAPMAATPPAAAVSTECEERPLSIAVNIAAWLLAHGVRCCTSFVSENLQ